MNTQKPYHVELDQDFVVRMTADEIRASFRARKIAPSTNVWREGMEIWMPLSLLIEELDLPAIPARRPPPRRTARDTMDAQQIMITPRSRGIYIMLALFLGPLGIHDFYAGYIGSALFILLVNLLTMGIGLIGTIPLILIECCAVKKDARGLPLQ